jgi:hypothetical protein
VLGCYWLALVTRSARLLFKCREESYLWPEVWTGSAHVNSNVTESVMINSREVRKAKQFITERNKTKPRSFTLTMARRVQLALFLREQKPYFLPSKYFSYILVFRYKEQQSQMWNIKFKGRSFGLQHEAIQRWGSYSDVTNVILTTL